MKTLREEVLSLPPADRLDHALFLIDEMSGNPDLHEAGLHDAFGLTPSETRLTAALHAAAPRVLTKAALYTAIYGSGSKADMKLVDVYVSKVRAKIGADAIVTHRGVGYSMPQAMALPSVVPSAVFSRFRAAVPWSAQDDADLMCMFGNGSCLADMAYELDRSERAVMERIKALRQKSRGQA